MFNFLRHSTKTFPTEAKVVKKQVESEDSGYKELRLGARRIFYRIREPAGMTNHSVLLVHGEDQDGKDFFLQIGLIRIYLAIILFWYFLLRTRSYTRQVFDATFVCEVLFNQIPHCVCFIQL